jgi:hypothetical protein
MDLSEYLVPLSLPVLMPSTFAARRTWVTDLAMTSASTSGFAFRQRMSTACTTWRAWTTLRVQAPCTAKTELEIVVRIDGERERSVAMPFADESMLGADEVLFVWLSRFPALLANSRLRLERIQASVDEFVRRIRVVSMMCFTRWSCHVVDYNIRVA